MRLLTAVLLMFAAVAIADDSGLPATAPDKLLVIDETVGSGRELLRGDFAVVHYDGWVWDDAAAGHRGLRFDSSRQRGAPLSLFYSPGRVIDGWYKGLKGMKTGGRRLLVIPPELGYGDRKAFGMVPPDSTLIFDIELLDVVPRQNS